LTARGRLALALGLAVYVAAWAFGSKPLYPVGTGLMLVVLLAWAWVRLSLRPMRLRRRVGDGDHFEGDDVPVRLVLEVEGRIAPPSFAVVERIAKLGEQRTPFERHSGRHHASYVLPSLPRGRYPYEEAIGVIEDPFGLQRATIPLGGAGALTVYPRLVELDAVFSEAGSFAHGGRRVLLRRPSGFDLHSVREYEQGESLRKVHWRSTARRGRLMVKELEDSPRDEVAVLLDADASAVAGDPPSSSFDVQVRAAGSILKANVRRGRRALLVVNAFAAESQRVHSIESDWRRALEVLAAAEPTGRLPVDALLADDESPAGRAADLTVVTARLQPGLVERLTQRALARRRVALVYVEAPTFAPGRRVARPEPALLRLQAVGIPVAVLARGDDLAAKLGSPEGALGAASG
jgi:uncharacterized protein (DUF58 family)